MNTLVLGASMKPERISNQAINRLVKKGHNVYAIGLKEGEVAGISIQTGLPKLVDVDTITLYLNPTRQVAYYEYMMSLSPKRIIFNPGTENPELITIAQNAGIETEIACTLVLLATDTY